jgi:hypothetical protein
LLEGGVMYSKFFVALNFNKNSNLSFKIDGFKKRFDDKYMNRPFPHMALLAPFKMRLSDKQALIEELKEEIETFFFGFTQSPSINFKGIGFKELKRQKMIHLNPDLGDDLTHCQDLVTDICKAFIPRDVKYKENDQQVVPLGLFYQNDQFMEAVDQAQIEFSNISELLIEGIALYEQKNGKWDKVEDLISFEVMQSFLHLSVNSL